MYNSEALPTEDSYLGEIRWSKRWHVGSQASAAFVAVFIGLMAYPLLTFVTRVREFQPIYFAPSIIVAAVAYWLVRPTTYTAYIGSYGVLRTCAYGFKVTREELMFKDAARVETGFQRVIANTGNRMLYDHTDVTLTWYDEGGAAIFQLAGTVRESNQRGEWSVTEGLDPAAERLSPFTPLGFAFAAKRAFEEYAKRGGPYRS